MSDLYKAGSAFGTATAAEYAELQGGASIGLVVGAALGALGYFMAPGARGNLTHITAGMMDGSAAWFGAKFAAPYLKKTFTPSNGTARRAVGAPRPTFASVARVSGPTDLGSL